MYIIPKRERVRLKQHKRALAETADLLSLRPSRFIPVGPTAKRLTPLSSPFALNEAGDRVLTWRSERVTEQVFDVRTNRLRLVLLSGETVDVPPEFFARDVL